MEDAAPLILSHPTRPGSASRLPDASDAPSARAERSSVSHETLDDCLGKRSGSALAAKRVAVIAGLLATAAGLAALCIAWGPELLAFVSDAPRFRSWVDETGALSRLAFVAANMAQVVLAFLPGEPLELAAGYAFGFWEGTLWCLLASALGTTVVMLLVRSFGSALVGLFFPPEKIASMRWLQDSRRFELLLFLCFLVPGTPKDLLTYVAGLGRSPVWRIVALTSIGRIPSIVSSTLAAGAFGDGDYAGAAIVAALTIALAGLGTIIYRKLSSNV